MTAAHGIGLCLAFMRRTANRDCAQGWAQEALSRGATPEQIAQAWAEWDREHEPIRGAAS